MSRGSRQAGMASNRNRKEMGMGMGIECAERRARGARGGEGRGRLRVWGRLGFDRSDDAGRIDTELGRRKLQNLGVTWTPGVCQHSMGLGGGAPGGLRVVLWYYGMLHTTLL